MEKLYTAINSFAYLPEDIREDIDAVLITKEIKKKMHLVSRGQQSRHIYFIESGLLRIYSDVGDREVTTWLPKENDFVISIGSFFEEKPAKDTIEALENTVLGCITRQQLMDLLHRHPKFKEHEAAIRNKYYDLNQQRVVALQGLTPEERYEWLMNRDPGLFNRVRKDILLSYLDMTEPTFDKIRNKRLPGRK